MKLFKNQKVTLVRGNLASSLAASLPNFFFWNPGVVKKVSGDRVAVKWPGAAALWFDGEALKPASATNPARRRRNPVDEPNSLEFEQARKAVAEAQRHYNTVTLDYRARKIGDAQFLKARSAMNEADKAFEEAYKAEVKRKTRRAPQLRRGERQGDIFANVQEPFALAGQKGIDHERIQREKEAKAKSARDFEASNQLGFAINPRRPMKNALKYFVGINVKNDRRQVFGAHTKPTSASHGRHFQTVIGPFASLRAALYYRDHGANNPQIRCPADAEKLCRVRSGPTYQRAPAKVRRRNGRARHSVRAVGKAAARGAQRTARPTRRKNPTFSRRAERFFARQRKKDRKASAKSQAFFDRQRRKNPRSGYGFGPQGKKYVIIDKVRGQGLAAPNPIDLPDARIRLAKMLEIHRASSRTKNEPFPYWIVPYRQTNPRRAPRKLSPAQLRAGFGGKRRRNPLTTRKVVSVTTIRTGNGKAKTNVKTKCGNKRKTRRNPSDPWKPKVRLTPQQKKAYAAYRFAMQQEDRYMGSVFVNSHGQRQHEAKVRAAYEECKRLGMGTDHGM